MPLESVPWFVGGGAEHSAEIARMLPYAAMLGEEGILGAANFTVRDLSTPGPQITVDPGSAIISNRASGGQYQSYIARSTSLTTVDIAPNNTSSTRWDLLVLRVEDPFTPGSTYPDPADPAVGPYVFLRVIPGASVNTKTLQSIAGHANDSGIALARIAIPANTGTITQSMITDLRDMASIKRQREFRALFPGANHDVPSATEVSLGSTTLTVPRWATRALVTANISGLALITNNANGYLRLILSGSGVTYATQDTGLDFNYAGSTSRHHAMCGGDLSIPAVQRGTTITVDLKARRTGGTGAFRADASSSIFIDVEFLEAPGD